VWAFRPTLLVYQPNTHIVIHRKGQIEKYKEMKKPCPEDLTKYA